MDKIEVEVTRELEDIVPGYLERLGGTITKLEELVQSAQLDEVKKLGHNLKGSGGGYGFARISELGALIEQAGKDNDAGAAARSIAELKNFASRVSVKFV